MLMLNKKLQIIAQGCHHDPAFIVGDSQGLTALRNAIEIALGKGEACVNNAFTTDGEGFDIIIACREDMGDVPLGYTMESAKDNMTLPEWLIKLAYP